ncbi:MAG: DUF1015 family protein [Deltaproteobacteria bacterium]|nr:DUF1015 family protein [Deltaproteobacteria bacterium]
MPHIAAFRGAVAGASERDAVRAIYRYHQTFALGGRPVTRKSLVCVVRLAPWSEGTIRPHEAALPAAREAELAKIRAARAHTGAVLAGYRDAATEVDRLFRSIDSTKPTLEQTSPDGTVHKLWRVQSAEVFGKLTPLFAPKKLHVLDGHARYEAMLAYQASLGELAQYSTGNYGLFCLVNLEDQALVVAPRHRIVKTGITRDELLRTKHFIVEKLAGAAKDAARQRAALGDTLAHQPTFVAVFAGDPDAWKLTLSPDVSPNAEGVTVHRALQKYDIVVLEHMLVPGVPFETTIDQLEVLAAVDKGAALGLLMRPMSLEQIVHADELGQVLPASADAFPPALLDFVRFPIDANEDVT